jgi:hypothetical protein
MSQARNRAMPIRDARRIRASAARGPSDSRRKRGVPAGCA